MERHCYFSEILPGKRDLVATHFEKKEGLFSKEEENQFWDDLGMVGFHGWLQRGPKCDYYLHCLEVRDGITLESVLHKLREKIKSGELLALSIHHFYLEAFGKDYLDPGSFPQAEQIFDLAYGGENPANLIKRAFIYPLKRDKVEEHLSYCAKVTNELSDTHRNSCQSCGVDRLTKWIQTTAKGSYLVLYTEGSEEMPLKEGAEEQSWDQISKILIDHTGLSYPQLHADLTQLI